MATPLTGAYAASKAYVLSLSESLSEELQGSGVSITALCPGITATAMFDRPAQTGQSGAGQVAVGGQHVVAAARRGHPGGSGWHRAQQHVVE